MLAGASTSAQDVIWEQTGGPISGTVTQLKSRSDGQIWCLASNRLYRSQDDGKTWTPASLPDRDLVSVAIRDQAEIFIAAGVFCTDHCFQSGVYYSDDNGESWRTIQVGPADNPVQLFTVGARGRVFAYMMDGVYFSDSGADTWLPGEAGYRRM